MDVLPYIIKQVFGSGFLIEPNAVDVDTMGFDFFDPA
jgi:hypothetical protein